MRSTMTHASWMELGFYNFLGANSRYDCSKPAAVANKVCSDSTRNEQVDTSVSRSDSEGSATFFSSRKILLFWKVFSWFPVICIFTLQRFAFLFPGRF